MYNYWLSVVTSLNRLLRLLGLRRERRYWGTVYDSYNKQPLDPAIVRLISASSGETVGECITDMTGKYSFLAGTGRYKILVKKAHYIFPSQKIQGDKDGVFENLYHGELFDVLDDSDVIHFNVPLDPLEQDWNQQAKKQVIKFYPRTEILFSSILTILFWIVFFLDMYSFIFRPSLLARIIALAYGAVFFTAFFLPRPRLWGRVRTNRHDLFVGAGRVELAYKNIPSVVVAKSNILEHGKFFLRAGKGSYLLKTTLLSGPGSEPLVLTCPVRVKEEGVVNMDVVI